MRVTWNVRESRTGQGIQQQFEQESSRSEVIIRLDFLGPSPMFSSRVSTFTDSTSSWTICRFLGELPISLFLISSLTYLRWYSISSQYSPYYVSSYFKDASPCFDFDNIIARWQCFIHIIDGASISSHAWSWYWRYLILSQYLPRNFASEVSLWKWKSLESRDVICFVILLQNWVISQNEYSSPNGIDSWQRRNKPLVFCVQRHLLFVPWKSISSVLLVFGSSLSKYMYCFVTKYSIVKLLYLDILK